MENDETESLKPSRRRNNESKKIWLKQEKNALLKKVNISGFYLCFFMLGFALSIDVCIN
jgi:hypothetical protein